MDAARIPAQSPKATALPGPKGAEPPKAAEPLAKPLPPPGPSDQNTAKLPGQGAPPPDFGAFAAPSDRAGQIQQQMKAIQDQVVEGKLDAAGLQAATQQLQDLSRQQEALKGLMNFKVAPGDGLTAPAKPSPQTGGPPGQGPQAPKPGVSEGSPKQVQEAKAAQRKERSALEAKLHDAEQGVKTAKMRLVALGALPLVGGRPPGVLETLAKADAGWKELGIVHSVSKLRMHQRDVEALKKQLRR